MSAILPVTLSTGSPYTTLFRSSAVLSGYFPTGSIVFTLTGPGGFLYTQTDPVTGNGTYMASTTLPTTDTEACAYHSPVDFACRDHHNATSDQGGTAEQTVVSRA